MYKLPIKKGGVGSGRKKEFGKTNIEYFKNLIKIIKNDKNLSEKNKKKYLKQAEKKIEYWKKIENAIS